MRLHIYIYEEESFLSDDIYGFSDFIDFAAAKYISFRQAASLRNSSAALSSFLFSGALRWQYSDISRDNRLIFLRLRRGCECRGFLERLLPAILSPAQSRYAVPRDARSGRGKNADALR